MSEPDQDVDAILPVSHIEAFVILHLFYTIRKVFRMVVLSLWCFKVVLGVGGGLVGWALTTE